ncbi:MAG: isochorismatase hydrolase [uncultured bacterium]|nr:MAG: isochorismatase hydrolase [uncultured bacterium]
MPSKALILVDFENEWIDKNSDYFVGDVSQLVEKTNKLIDHCRKDGYKIIFTTHVEKDSDGEFAPGSKNVEIIPELHKQNSDVLIVKNKISPFYGTNLEEELDGIQEIVICGVLTNLCVRSLAQDAYDRDFKITVIKDCCRAFDEETHEFTIKDLKATREEIEFLNADEFNR